MPPSIEVPFAGIDSGQEETEAIQRVMASGWLAAGPEVQAFEEEFAAFTESKYAVCVNSGSSGLLLALKALKLPPGSKVLTAACGFPATLTPILHCGFTRSLWTMPSLRITWMWNKRFPY